MAIENSSMVGMDINLKNGKTSLVSDKFIPKDDGFHGRLIGTTGNQAELAISQNLKPANSWESEMNECQ